MINTYSSTGVLSLFLTLLLGCATDYDRVFPPDIQKTVNQTVSFPQVKESPSTYQGTVIMVGGEVLSAKRFEDHTQLTLLQLPLTDYQDPSPNRTDSQGRFIATQKEFLDPATVPPGTRLTLIGEVSGAVTELLDEMEYAYPTITIQHLRVWPEMSPSMYGYGPYAYDPYYYWYSPYYLGPYWGAHRMYFGPYPFWPYPYWW